MDIDFANDAEKVKKFLDILDWEDIEPNGNVSRSIFGISGIDNFPFDFGNYHYDNFSLEVSNLGEGLVAITCY